MVNIHFMSLALAEKILAVVVGKAPEKVLVHIAITVPLSRQNQHIESFVGANQRVHDSDRVRRMRPALLP